MSRTACAWIPRFELTARLVDAHDLAGEAVIIADAGSTRAVVLDASVEARGLGVRPQMTMSAARALCPEATIIPPDPAFVRRTAERVLRALYALAPVVGHDQRGAFFLSLDGLERIHPDERILGQRIREALATLQLPCVVAIADEPLGAWIAARHLPVVSAEEKKRGRPGPSRAIPRGKGRLPARIGHPRDAKLTHPPLPGLALSPRASEGGERFASCAGEGLVVVEQGRDQAFIAALPIEAIPMPEEVNRLCRLLGLDRVADLQRLPPGALGRRFGRAGEMIEQRAFARSREVFRVEIPQIVEQEVLHLDHPTDDLEALLFLHKSVLDRLLAKVARTRRCVAAVQLRLKLADAERSTAAHTLRPARPTLEGRPLLELLTLWLTSRPLPGPVDSICARAIEVCTATARQLTLFARQEELADEALSEAIARLTAAFGNEAVVSPQLRDCHRPEARLGWIPVTTEWATSRSSAARRAQPPGAPAREEARPEMGAAPVLSFVDPPRPIDLGSRWVSDEQGRRSVVSVDGPYLVESEWWEGGGFARSYLLVLTGEGEHWWVYRDASGTYLHAYLD